MTEEMPLLHAKGGELNIHNRHLDELRFFRKEAAARHEHPMRNGHHAIDILIGEND